MTGDEVTKLRYRRLGGGYRREDVEAALEKLLEKVRSVEANVDELRSRASELENELRAAKAELQAYRAREARLDAAVQRAEDVLARAGGE
jgi:chromosome segregation ATPase